MNDSNGPLWRRSSYSGSNNNCLEILTPPPAGLAPIRDSKDPTGQVINFSAEAWTTFVHALCEGEFDLPTATPHDDAPPSTPRRTHSDADQSHPAADIRRRTSA